MCDHKIKGMYNVSIQIPNFSWKGADEQGQLLDKGRERRVTLECVYCPNCGFMLTAEDVPVFFPIGSEFPQPLKDAYYAAQR